MSNKFHITVGSYPSRELNIDNELKLIKTSLLYADQTKLCSLQSSLIISILSFASLSENQKMECLENILLQTNNDLQQITEIKSLFSMYHKLLKKKKNKQELLLMLRLKKEFQKLFVPFEEELKKIAITSGINELIPAIESGLLEVDIYGKSKESVMDDFTSEFIASLGEALISRKTYPLFDDKTGKLINVGIKERLFKFSDSSSNKAKHVGFVSNIMQRLPTFDRAKVDEILDIRKSLEKPLIRFRSAIFRLSEEIAHPQWDENFYYDSEKLFYREIKPAVEEIEEESKSNKYLSKLLSQVVDNSLGIPATNSMLGMIIAKLRDFSEISAISFGIAAGAGTVAMRAMKEWKEKTKKIKRNQIYFYYKTGKMLNK